MMHHIKLAAAGLVGLGLASNGGPQRDKQDRGQATTLRQGADPMVDMGKASFPEFRNTESIVAFKNDDKSPSVVDKKTELTAAEKIEKIKEKTELELKALREELQPLYDTKTNQEDVAVQIKRKWANFLDEQAKRCEEILSLAKLSPKSDISRDAACWIISNIGSHNPAVVTKTIDFFTDNFAGDPLNPNITGRFVHEFSFSSQQSPAYSSVIKLIERLEKNKNVTICGQAKAVKGKLLLEAYRLAEKNVSPDAAAIAEKVIVEFTNLKSPEHAKLPYLGDDTQKTLGEFAEQQIQSLRVVRVGKPLPYFEAETLNGEKIRSTEHHKKNVLMMVCWRSDCIPCLKQVEDDRRLLAFFDKQPFKILGINLDEDRAAALEAQKKHNIPFPSAWDDSSKSFYGKKFSVFGSVNEIPDIFILDHKGILQARNPKKEKLQGLLIDLVAKAKLNEEKESISRKN